MTDDPIMAAIQSHVDAGELAGATYAVWQRGQAAQVAAVGWSNVETRDPMTRESLFRIASMTKPITSMAALVLMEQGRFELDDPITNWAPEFEHMRVLNSPDGPLDDASPALRAITFEDLLTHRSGLTYGAFHSGPLMKAYADSLGGDIDTDVRPDEWISRLAALPLIDQPGAAFHYGCSTDLLGLLLARIEGAPLGNVLQRLIFEPLGMKDTCFTVPEHKRGRRAGQYGFDAHGRLKSLAQAPGGATVAERPVSMLFQSGGQGLWSTVDDYLAFARMFIERGEVKGVRLLRPETLALMTANRLSPHQSTNAALFGIPTFGTGHGFGLGVAVVIDPATASLMRGQGGVGTVSWPGAYGGWWQADPTNGSVMIFLAHNMPELDQLANGVGLGVYTATAELHALACARVRASA
jgi:CubicO group peptidase (beta-lactamase class C family)